MKKRIKYLDKPLLIVTVLLFIFGLVMIFSASNVVAYMSYNVSAYHYFIKQGIFLIISLILFLVMIRFSTKTYGKVSFFLLLILMASLVGLILFVDAKNDARSWFDLGPISIQPSEFIKVVIIAFLAYYYDKNKSKLDNYGIVFFPIVLCLLVAGLIFIQPDLGTTIIFSLLVLFIFFAVPIAKQIKFKTVAASFGVLLIGAVILLGSGEKLLQDRQLQRFDFFNPCDKLLTTGNQVCNCYIAINNGGFTGVGLGNSTQKYLYLAEPYTDFIFAIIVEELGVITGVLLIGLYIFIIYRILLIGRRSKSNRGATICYGVAIYLFLHISINLLGILGLMPMTGVPLPFMSYGGSFTLCLVAALTMVQRVSIENGLELNN